MQPKRPFKPTKGYLNAWGALYGSAVVNPTPQPKKRRVAIFTGLTEHQEQVAVVKWCNKNHLFIHSIPNEGERSVGGHNKKIAAGMVVGACDLFLAHPTSAFSGFYIEMKRRGQKPKPAQYDFMEKVRKRGYAAAWFDNHEQAIKAIEEYLK